jgi:hypothetical protein
MWWLLLKMKQWKDKLNETHHYAFSSGIDKASHQCHTEGGGLGCSNPSPPPKFWSFDEAKLNSQLHGKYIRSNLFANWEEPLTWGILPPDSRSLWPQLKMLNPAQTKFVGTPLPPTDPMAWVGAQWGTEYYNLLLFLLGCILFFWQKGPCLVMWM